MSALTLTLKVNGRPLSEAIELLAVDVVREVNRISRAQLVLIDGDTAERRFELSDQPTFATGQEVEILARHEGEAGGNRPLFKGIVIGQQVEAGPQGSRLTVSLKDQAVRLTFGRQSRTFVNQTDSQVIDQIIRNHGLKSGKIAATSLKHPELVQYQATDWDFLLLRAEANGLLVLNEDGALSVEPPNLNQPARHQVEVGLDEVYDFDLRLDTGSQTGQAFTAAWDIKAQKLTNEVRSKPVPLKQGQLSPAEITAAAGKKGKTSLNGVAASQPAELQPWVDGALARQRLGLLQGRFSLPGSAAYRLLDPLKIGGIGRRFNGTTLITAFRHRITTSRGWITDIQFGLDPQSFAARPDIPPPAAGGLLPPIGGLHIGLVADFKKDPDGHYRVQVRLYGERDMVLWARVAFPDAGPNRGLVFWPEPGDEVVVGFINDDPRQPIVLGSLFSQNKSVPDQSLEPSAKNTGRGLVSKKKTRLIFIDDDKAEVLVSTAAGKTIHLDEKEDKILIQDQHGNEITLDKNGITLISGKDLVLEAKGQVEIKGQTIDLK